MSVRDPLRLRAVLGTAAWQWWRERAREHLEAGRPLPAVVTLTQPSAEQRQAANRLFSRPGQQGAVQVAHAQLLALLIDAGIADDLLSCLEELDGPLRNRKDEQTLESLAWAALGEAACARLGELSAQSAQRLQHGLERGWVRRLSAQEPAVAERLLSEAISVLRILMQQSTTSLAILAASGTGDAHALDRDRPLGRLVLRLAGADPDMVGVLAWRAAWTGLGVETDALSASALVLNLRAHGDSPAARLLNAAADAGEPLRMTARLMQRDPDWQVAADGCVSVCENPSVVAAAATRLGARCRPLICVDGQPASPVLMLLGRLQRGAIPCRYHGDFDWPGIAIARDLMRRFDMSAWRYGSGDLLQARHLPGPPLEGVPLDTPWDPSLSSVLHERGKSLHEEVVMELLLSDLDRDGERVMAR